MKEEKTSGSEKEGNIPTNNRHSVNDVGNVNSSEKPEVLEIFENRKHTMIKFKYMAIYGSIVGILLGFLIYLIIMSAIIFVLYPTEIIRPESYIFLAVNNLIRLSFPFVLVFIMSIIAGIGFILYMIFSWFLFLMEKWTRRKIRAHFSSERYDILAKLYFLVVCFDWFSYDWNIWLSKELI